MEQVRYQLSTLYAELHMGCDPRWLTTESERVGKEASSVVITLVGQLTMKDVIAGPPLLYLFNCEISLMDYVSFQRQQTNDMDLEWSTASPPPRLLG
jgi:hypothetical protein